MPRTCEAGGQLNNQRGDENDENNNDNTNRRGCGLDPYQMIPNKCKFIDQQSLKLQENPEEVPAGEKHELTGLSYTSSANHSENMNAIGTRVVSCNTTGLSRTLVPLYEHCGSLKVECTMIRRAADPGDSGKGPINAIKPVLKVPSHHGPDVMTVKPEIDINSLAVAVPTTIMHVHRRVIRRPARRSSRTDGADDVVMTSETSSSTSERVARDDEEDDGDPSG